MMRKSFLCMCVGSLCLLGQNVQAADDVYVDLSVLDSIPQEHMGFVSSQPLFPVMKKTTAPQKKIKVRSKPKTPIFVPEPKPEVPHTADDIKTEPLVPIVKSEKIVQDPEINNVTIPVKPETEDEAMPIPLITKRNLVKSTLDNKDITSEPVSESKETMTTTSISSEEKLIEGAIQPQPSSSAAVLTAKVSDTTMEITGIKPREVYSLQFYPDSSEITSDAERMLNEMVQKFNAERRKKILIKAHNYEVGDNAFRKKRISLMRATNIRSFFLSQGFKNFSIKLINTTADDEYRDTVEIEEVD